MWKRSLLDVKVKRGADVGSDHHSTTADIKLKLRANGKNTRSWKQFDIEKLKESNVRKEYTTLIRNRFRILENLNDEDDTETTDDKWGEISEIFTKCAEESIGFKQKQKHKDWITPRTWDNIIIRRETKKKLNEAKSQRLKERYQLEHSQIHRNVNRMVRNDKRANMDSLAEKAEEAANKGEKGNLYKITKIICGKNTASSNIHVKDKLGNLLTSENEQEQRWTEHFSELLNRPTPTELPIIAENNNELEISIEPPEMNEIIPAIKSIRNGKSPGNDNLNAELFKLEPVIDWIMRQTTANTPRDIRWGTFTTLENLDFADDLAFI
ncbi:uncharacterized protein LOC143078515 [Mytilus galloprovincialis]|uniref:uncharacterized protein LOC143078515 n=1 Tax=Mytilus galloprovincialis TaxID=29158 RepID=UPI003F7C0375